MPILDGKKYSYDKAGIAAFLKAKIKKNLSFNHNQTNKQVNTETSLTGPFDTKLNLKRTRNVGGPSNKKFSLKKNFGKGFTGNVSLENGIKSANIQFNKSFKDGGMTSPAMKKNR